MGTQIQKCGVAWRTLAASSDPTRRVVLRVEAHSIHVSLVVVRHTNGVYRAVHHLHLSLAVKVMWRGQSVVRRSNGRRHPGALLWIEAEWTCRRGVKGRRYVAHKVVYSAKGRDPNDGCAA